MPKVRVAGVPEHFNEPWVRAQSVSAVEFHTFPGGTGAMCQALESNQVDAALLLTEGAVKYCFEKQTSLIHSVYVESPLVWGVHCGRAAKWPSLEAVGNSKQVTFAISRHGSGSHLMAFVLAKKMNWTSIQFEVVGNIKGAKELLTKQPDTLFMWEKAMTDPLVEEGTFTRLGECPTPWPCFVLCVRKDFDVTLLEPILQAVMAEIKAFKMSQTDTVEHVVNKFGIKQQLVEEWFQAVRFGTFDAQSSNLPDLLGSVRATLVDLGQLAGDLSHLDPRSITVAKL